VLVVGDDVAVRALGLNFPTNIAREHRNRTASIGTYLTPCTCATAGAASATSGSNARRKLEPASLSEHPANSLTLDDDDESQLGGTIGLQWEAPLPRGPPLCRTTIARVRWRVPTSSAGLREVARGEPMHRTAKEHDDQQIRCDRLNGAP
jgi:hypothetical protein